MVGLVVLEVLLLSTEEMEDRAGRGEGGRPDAPGTWRGLTPEVDDDAACIAARCALFR